MRRQAHADFYRITLSFSEADMEQFIAIQTQLSAKFKRPLSNVNVLRFVLNRYHDELKSTSVT